MSIPGWESLGTNDPTRYKATIPGITKTGSGGVDTPNQNLRVVTNKATGNFDVYEPNIFGDKPIYSYNASNNKIIEVDKDKFKQYFSGTKGKAQLENTNKQIKTSTLKIAEKDAGPNPTPTIKKELEDLKKSPGYKSEANKATQEETPTTPATETAGPTDAGKAFGATAPKGGFGNFTYPEDLGSTKQDVIKFTMLQYKPSGLGPVGQQAGTFGNSRRDETSDGMLARTAGTVVLPIPSGISDTNACDWGQNNMNALDAALAAASFTGITEGLGKGVESFGKSLKSAIGDKNTARGIGAAFAGAAIGGNSAAILSRADGVVINPNLELLFGGPTLRPFSFTFKMSARNKGEAKQIIGILNFFKRGMSPIKTESNLFLKSPNTFKIQYLHLGKNGVDHPYIGRIKECALQSVVVSYAPEGQYATYTDGVMVSYEMQMQFQELEPIFNSDYEGLSGIGY